MFSLFGKVHLIAEKLNSTCRKSENTLAVAMANVD